MRPVIWRTSSAHLLQWGVQWFRRVRPCFFSRETQEFPMTYGRRRGQATSGDFFSFILLLFNMFLPFWLVRPPPPLSPSLGLTPTNNRMSAIFPLLSPLFFVCSIEDALSEIWFQWPSQKVICTPNWLSSKCCANWTTLASHGAKSGVCTCVCSLFRKTWNPVQSTVCKTWGNKWTPCRFTVKLYNTLMQKSWRLPSVLTTVDGYLEICLD